MMVELSKLDNLYQKHTGEECYIFGDGISLKWMDLRQFADRPSLVGNILIFHKEAEALIKPYCAIIEPYWFYPIFPYRGNGKLQIFKNYLNQEYRKYIATNPETLFFINLSNYPVVKSKNALFISRWYKPKFEKLNPFRDRNDSHYGSFKFQISLAIFLGYKKAYLIGHDYTHFDSKTLHFYEKGTGRPSGDKQFSVDFIDHAKKYIDLTTITLNTHSNTMNSLTYKEFTGKEPIFRENHELIDKLRLEYLSKDKRGGGYLIF
jgi:hypothetical protein